MKFSRSLSHMFNTPLVSPSSEKKLAILEVPMEELSPQRSTANEERRLSVSATARRHASGA